MAGPSAVTARQQLNDSKQSGCGKQRTVILLKKLLHHLLRNWQGSKLAIEVHMRRRKEEAMCFHQEDQLLPILQSSYSRVRSGLPSKQLAQSFAEAANKAEIID